MLQIANVKSMYQFKMKKKSVKELLFFNSAKIFARIIIIFPIVCLLKALFLSWQSSKKKSKLEKNQFVDVRSTFRRMF